MSLVFRRGMNKIQEKLLHENDAKTNIQAKQTEGITGLFYRRYIAAARDFALRFKGKVVLDIGAGDGIILENTQLNPIVVDISSLRCQRLRDKYKNVICASADDIPLPDNSVDCALLIALLEHVSSPEKVIDEAYRLLKRTGEAVILIPNDIVMSIGRVLLLKFPPRYPGHISFMTPKRVKESLRGKFEIVKEYKMPFSKLSFWLSLYYIVFVRKL